VIRAAQRLARRCAFGLRPRKSGMAELSPDIERLGWRPAHFRPLAEGGGAVRSALLFAAERCDAARDSDDLVLMQRALLAALAEPRSPHSSHAALAATLDVEPLRAYEAAVDDAGVMYDRAVEALVAEVGGQLLSAGPRVATALGLVPLYHRAIRSRLQVRSDRQDEWYAKLRQLTLTSTTRILDELGRDEQLGTVEVDGVGHELTKLNLDSLLAHPHARVRRSAAESLRANARRTRRVHEVIKLARLSAVHELSALRGFGSPLEEYRATSGMTVAAVEAQRAMEGRLLELCHRHAEYKRSSFGLDDLEECDLTAMSSPAPTDLSLRRLLTALSRRLSVFDDRYPACLQQPFTCGTILTDVNAARSRSYFVIASAHGGLPLVHAPYVRDFAIRQLTGVVRVFNRITLKRQVSVTAVKERVQKALDRQARTDTSAIKVDASGSTVTLSGAASSFQSTRDAANAAWGAPGVLQVVDHMTVSPTF
jgi:BON domain